MTIYDEVIEYLTANGRNEKVASILAEKVCRYNDIAEEFHLWLQKEEFPVTDSLTVEGYSAKEIFELAPFMDGIGVYNFLVTLREKPGEAKKIIDAGFPRK